MYNKSIRHKLGSHKVEETIYPNLSAVATEYGIPLNTIYKRYSRGSRGNDLIPRNRHKSFVEPVLSKNYKFFVKGIAYKSKADACRKNNINYITFRKRLQYGWSLEDALTVPTQIYFNPNNTLGSGTAKNITIEGKQFCSIAVAARTYGLTPENVHQSLKEGNSIEVAFKLEKKKSVHEFEYNGKYYHHLRHLAEELDFPYNLLSSRVNFNKLSIDEALSLGKAKILSVGRYNKTIFERNSKLAESMGELYFANVIINQNKRCKIGITSQKAKDRLSKEFSWYNIIKLVKMPLYNCYLIETKLLNIFSKYRDLSIKPDQLDGYQEVFDFPEEIIEEIKSIINTYE